jgi:oligosaccharide repeat unit polymerase
MSRNELNSYLLQLSRAALFVFLCLIGSFFKNTSFAIFLATIGFALVLFEFVNSLRLHKRFKNYFAEIIVWLSLLIWFWFEAISMAWANDKFQVQTMYSPFLDTFPDSVVASAFLQISLFQAFAFITLFLFKNISLPNVSLKTKVIPKWLVGYLFVFLALLGWITLFINSKSFFQSLFLFRESDVEIKVGFLAYLTIVSIAISGLSLAMIVCTKHRTSTLIWTAFILGGVLAFFSGTRFKIVYVILPAFICAYHIYQQRKFDFRFGALIFFILSSLILLASVQFVIRYDSNMQFGLFSAFLGSGHFSALANAIGLADKLSEPFKQPMGTLFITDFVPRFIWPDKPAHQYWEFYNMSLAPVNGNVTPSMLGQYYMNWWSLGGIFSGCIIGFISAIASRLIVTFNETNNFYTLAKASFILTFIFLSFRVFTANYITYVVVIYIIAPLTIKYAKGNLTEQKNK